MFYWAADYAVRHPYSLVGRCVVATSYAVQLTPLHPTGGPVNQHRLSGRNPAAPPKPEHRGEVVLQQACGRDERKRRNAERQLTRGERHLGKAAPEDRERCDAIARRHIRVSGRLPHYAADLNTRDKRWLWLNLVLALSQEEVYEGHTRHVDVDQDHPTRPVGFRQLGRVHPIRAVK